MFSRWVNAAKVWAFKLFVTCAILGRDFISQDGRYSIPEMDNHSISTPPRPISPPNYTSMQKSGRTSARREENKDQSRERKRRRFAEDSTAPVLQQQTISELFSTGQQKTSQTTKPVDPLEDPHANKLAEIPRNKRQKLRPSSPAPEKLPATSMYSFPSRSKTNGSNVIDLTDSPNASPSPRKPLKLVRSTYNPNLGAKKIVVKNLRTVPRTDPHEYLDQTWKKLDVSLDAIFCGKAIPCSMEELYKGAENVCRQGHSAELCGRLEQKAQLYAGELQKSLLQSVDSQSTLVLQGVVNAWSRWNKHMVGVPGHIIALMQWMTYC